MAPRRRTWQLLNRLRESSEMTLFLTTHYLEETASCDRMAVIHRGQLVKLGTSAEVQGDAPSLEEAFVRMTV